MNILETVRQKIFILIVIVISVLTIGFIFSIIYLKKGQEKEYKMPTFICTVCQNRIKEHGSNVDCGYYNDTRPMIEDTTKLYDKSFLCSRFVHVRYKNIDTCKSKRKYSCRYDALCAAKTIFVNNSKVLRPYKCKICKSWHLTHECQDGYNPKQEYDKARKAHRLYD